MTPPYGNSFKHALISRLASAYLGLAGATTRLAIKHNPQAKKLEDDGVNFIYAVWHAQQVFLIYTHRFRKVCALVSQSKDGEYMARVLLHFGMNAVRGSTSKGGTQALLGLIDAANEGYHPVLTPDGPRGPKRTVQPGIIFLAQKTGLPIVPVACGLSAKIVFNSWDKFRLPLPFGKACVVYGNPITVSETDDTGSKAAEIQAELNRISDEADAQAA